MLVRDLRHLIVSRTFTTSIRLGSHWCLHWIHLRSYHVARIECLA